MTVLPLHLSRLALATLLGATVAISSAAAQQPKAAKAGSLPAEITPEIRGVLVNSQTVLDRLELVLGMTTPDEQKQHAELKNFVDVFLFGVDLDKAVRMDLMTGSAETSYRLSVPVADFKEFWQLNLVPLGIPVQRYPKYAYLYKLGGKPTDAYTGYMMYEAGKRGDYATIVETSDQLPQPKGPPPTEAVTNLLSAGYDVALHLQNANGEPASVDQRHAHFASQRAKDLEQLKRDVDESPADFAFRKLSTQVQFAESERLYAEAKNLVAGLIVSPDKASGNLSLHIEPLPETSLATSVAILGQEPGRFSGIPRGENASTSGRIHFVLDDVRKKNLLELTQAARDKAADDVDTTEGATPEEKAADKEFIGGFFDRVDAGLNDGVLDGFVEMTKGQDGIYSLVGAVKSVDGTKWADVIAILPRTSRKTNLKMNVAEHAGYAIHEIMISETAHTEFHKLFGGPRLLLATGPDSIWYAAGPDAEAALKQAIDQAATPGETEAQVISFRGELLPWVKILDQRLDERGRDAYRELAIAAFQNGEGRVNLTLERKGDAVDGQAAVDRGVLRFIGKALAKFSAEQLATE